MRPKLMVLPVALCVLALAKADLPPVLLPGLDDRLVPQPPPPPPPVSKEVGWVDVDWGTGGIGRAADREKKAPGLWVWCRVHNDLSIATVVLRKNPEGAGWRVMASLDDADGAEWRTAEADWVPGNTAYPGRHMGSGIGVTVWVDVGTAPPE